MTRYREKSSEGTYIVSSYVLRTEYDLRNGTTKKLLKKVIKLAKQKFGFTFYKLQVQKNAFTMFITPEKGDPDKISEILQWIKSRFAKAWNRIHKMRGTFWADRFDSELILSDEIVKEMESAMKTHLLCFLILYSRKLHKILRKLKADFIPTVAPVT
jgi:hypothetical protein